MRLSGFTVQLIYKYYRSLITCRLKGTLCQMTLDAASKKDVTTKRQQESSTKGCQNNKVKESLWETHEVARMQQQKRLEKW